MQAMLFKEEEETSMNRSAFRPCSMRHSYQSLHSSLLNCSTKNRQTVMSEISLVSWTSKIRNLGAQLVGRKHAPKVDHIVLEGSGNGLYVIVQSFLQNAAYEWLMVIEGELLGASLQYDMIRFYPLYIETGFLI